MPNKNKTVKKPAAITIIRQVLGDNYTIYRNKLKYGQSFTIIGPYMTRQEETDKIRQILKNLKENRYHVYNITQTMTWSHKQAEFDCSGNTYHIHVCDSVLDHC